MSMYMNVKVDGTARAQSIDISQYHSIADLKDDVMDRYKVADNFNLTYVIQGKTTMPLNTDEDLQKLKIEYRSKQGGNLGGSAPIELIISTARFIPNPVPAIKINTKHTTVQCDECKQQAITGYRYKSVTRDNFDLCEKCANSAKYSNEAFLRLPMYNQNLSREVFSTNIFKQFVDVFRSNI